MILAAESGVKPLKTVLDFGGGGHLQNAWNTLRMIRNALLLLLGLTIGVAASFLIRGSMLPADGTPEAQILSLETELRDTRLRLAKIDPNQARQREDINGALSAGARAALDDLKAGRPVDMNNIYQALKPIMRDLSPIFDKMRRRDERRHFEHLAGEMQRKYKLSAPQQEALKVWLKDRADRNADEFKKVAFDPNTRFEDLAKAGRGNRPSDGLDGFMETQLQSPMLETFRRDRLTERANRVQNEADGKVERLHQTVNLDEAQKDQVFSIMARSSQDFDPTMQLEGVSADTPVVGRDGRDEAIRQVLRPDQQTSYDNWKIERRTKAEIEANEMGFQLPANWDSLNGD
jgi:hypothetical protein